MENTLNIKKKQYLTAYIKKAFSDFKVNWKVLVLGIIIFYAAIFLVEKVFAGHFGFAGMIIYQLFAIFLSIGITRLFLDTIDNKKTNVGLIFTGVTGKQFLNALGVTLIFMALGFFISFAVPLLSIGAIGLAMLSPWVLVAIGLPVSILLVILSIAISLYLFAIIDRDKGIFSSLSYSWNITKGYRFKMFILSLLSILIVFAGILALGVGVLVAIPIISLMQTQLYRELAGSRTAEIADNEEITKVVSIEKIPSDNLEDIIEA